MGYDAKLPEKQKTKRGVYYFTNANDVTNSFKREDILDSIKSAEFLVDFDYSNEDLTDNTSHRDLSSAEIIKKYFSNPIGVLPYFPPLNK
jgi:hypothetical protein